MNIISIEKTRNMMRIRLIINRSVLLRDILALDSRKIMEQLGNSCTGTSFIAHSSQKKPSCRSGQTQL